MEKAKVFHRLTKKPRTTLKQLIQRYSRKTTLIYLNLEQCRNQKITRDGTQLFCVDDFGHLGQCNFLEIVIQTGKEERNLSNFFPRMIRDTGVPYGVNRSQD